MISSGPSDGNRFPAEKLADFEEIPHPAQRPITQGTQNCCETSDVSSQGGVKTWRVNVDAQRSYTPGNHRWDYGVGSAGEPSVCDVQHIKSALENTRVLQRFYSRYEIFKLIILGRR